MTERKNQKNRLRYGAKLSEYKTNKLLGFFVDDFTAAEAAKLGNVDIHTAHNYFSYFRRVAAFSACSMPELFGGAGFAIMLGASRYTTPILVRYLERHKYSKKTTNNSWLEHVAWPLILFYSPCQFSQRECGIFLTIGTSMTNGVFEEPDKARRPTVVAEHVWKAYLTTKAHLLTEEAWDKIIEHRGYSKNKYEENLPYAKRDLRWALLNYGKIDVYNTGQRNIPRSKYFDELRKRSSEPSGLTDDLKELSRSKKLINLTAPDFKD